MHPYRTRFRKEIVAEFLPPAALVRSPKKRGKRLNKVIILCMGMPSGGSLRPLVTFFSKKGYWVFQPRYRGSWESGGRFLRLSPGQDVLDIIGQLPRGFKDFYSGRTYSVRPEELHVLGMSFGGPAAILASRDKRVTKAVALSPVVDWKDHVRHGETFDWLLPFVRNAFGEAYRFSERDWQKQKSGRFYNPMAHVREVDGRKLFIIHAKDDDVVRYGPVKKFAKLTGAKLWTLPRGGHLSSSNLVKPRFWKYVAAFLKRK